MIKIFIVKHLAYIVYTYEKETLNYFIDHYGDGFNRGNRLLFKFIQTKM